MDIETPPATLWRFVLGYRAVLKLPGTVGPDLPAALVAVHIPEGYSEGRGRTGLDLAEANVEQVLWAREGLIPTLPNDCIANRASLVEHGVVVRIDHHRMTSSINNWRIAVSSVSMSKR